MLIAVLGNMLTLMAVFRNKKLRTIPNLFVISLAISDLGMGLTCMPLSLSVLVTSSWMFGDVVCQFEGYVAIIMAAASTQTLAAMAVNRYVGIVKCLLYRSYFTTKRTICLLVGLWVSSIFAPFVYLIAGDRFMFHPGKLFCYVNLKAAWFTAFLVVIYVGIPSTIILVCYAKVFQTISARNKHYRKNQKGGDMVTVEEIRITRTLFVIVLFYMVCWTPVLIIDLVDTFLGRWAAPRTLYLAYTFLASISSSANPVIYGVMNQSFRKEYSAILKILQCLKFGQSTHVGPNSSDAGTNRATKSVELTVGVGKKQPPYLISGDSVNSETLSEARSNRCFIPSEEDDETTSVTVITRL
jgi:melatonin receptor type 1A